jgi:PIN domain nuclease of toxin-antitoxin system
MRLLLDTNIFFWAFYEEKRLSSFARTTIEDAEAIFISSVSIWEIAIKASLGKMTVDPIELAGKLNEANFQELPVFNRHVVLVTNMPLHHRDPFDRLLVAQAMSESLHLLTADKHLKPYSSLVLCV